MSKLLDRFRGKNESLNKLRSAIEKTQKKGFDKDDEGYWKPTLDKTKSCSAIVRLLPVVDGESFTQVHKHSFKGPSGGWYIERSRTTLGELDPVGDLNSRCWDVEALKDAARARARRTTYTVNVLVVSDPAAPDNEGKVFLYRMPKSLFAMVDELANPTDESDEALDPFHPLTGANFRIRGAGTKNGPNYAKSKFESPSPLCGGDEDQIEAVLAQVKDTTVELDPKLYKSYDELKTKLNRVLGFDTSKFTSARDAAEGNSSVGAGLDEDDEPVTTSKPAVALQTAKAWVPPTIGDIDDDDKDSGAFGDDDED